MAKDQQAVEARLQKSKTIREFIMKPKIMNEITAIIVTTLDPERFMRVFYSQIMLNPDILDCSNMSLLSTMIQSAQIGLEPILQRAALIPYKGVVTFQPMYRGHILLARNTGKVKVTSRVIFTNENYKVAYGSEEKITHEPMLSWNAEAPRGEPVGAYTVWTYADGDQTFTFMPWSEIIEIRDAYSQSWKGGKKSPWRDRPYEMAKKTVIKNHSKTEPCSIYMDHAVNIDNRVETDGTATGVFLPAPGEQSRSQFDPEEVQERFLASVHDLDKATGSAADIHFGDVPKLTDDEEEPPKQPPTLEEKFTALMDKEVGGYDPRLYMEYLSGQAAGKHPVEKYLEYAMKSPAEFRKHFVAWAGPPPLRSAGGPEKKGTIGPKFDFAAQYKHKRRSDDPKKGLLGWYGKNEKEVLTEWPVDELRKLHAKFVHNGYAEREIPTPLLNKIGEGDKPSGNAGGAPGGGESAGNRGTGITRAEIAFIKKARETLPGIEGAETVKAEEFMESVAGYWTKDKAPTLVEWLNKLVTDDAAFQDELWTFMDSMREPGQDG
jgi:recombination protein RecT